MVPFEEEHKMALISCVERVLMSVGGGANYNLVIARLGALYGCSIFDSYEHPEYLRTVLKEVYHEKYNSIIEEIKLQLDDLVYEKDIAEFFKVMES